MLKRTYLSIALVVVTMFIVFGVLAQIITTTSNKSPLSMEAKVIPGAVYSTAAIPIEIVFRNNEDEAVNLLNIFDDSTARRIFFSFNLRDINGTPINTLGGGKISLSKDSMKYLELKKDGEYTVRLDLKEFLPEDYSLKPGAYNVSVVYHSHYGENCFKGNLESNVISLHLTE